MSKQTQRLYDFGPFRLDAGERLLLRDGIPIPLQPKAFDILLVLVQNNGRLIKKDDLMEAVWPGLFVEEVNLSSNISLLRKALGEKQNGHKYIETVPKHGYRFTACVCEVVTDTEDTVFARSGPNNSPASIEQSALAAAEYSSTSQQGTHSENRREPKSIVSLFLAGLLLLASASVAGWFYLRVDRANIDHNGALVAGSLAVLPFRSLNHDADDKYLSVGIADTLITKLSKLRQLTVRPTSAVLRYDGAKQHDAMAVGRALQTEAVLEGSIHRVNDRIRITVRLVSVKDGSTVWADAFDQSFDDLLAVQDSISERVARALMLSLSREDRLQLTKRHTNNAEAYRLYLMGRYIWNQRGVAAVIRSISYFEQAIALDPNFALAQVGLADSHVMVHKPATEAERAVRRALEIDDQLGEAHASLGFILMFVHWDWPGAQREFRRAIELSPNYPTAHHWYGVYLSLNGRLDEAKEEMRRALEIDPTSTIMHADLAQLHYFSREYEEAEKICRRVLEMDANSEMPQQYLYYIHLKQGRHAESFAAWMKGQEYVKNDSAAAVHYRRVFATSGMRGVWQEQLNRFAKDPQAPALHMAIHHTLLGNKEQAIRWLNRAAEEHTFLLPFMNIDPIYDDLRTDPRFQELNRRIGLGR